MAAVMYLGLAASSLAGNVPGYAYQYVPLDPTVPAGCLYFNPVALDQAGRVYGTTDCGGETFVARYAKGHTTIISGSVSGHALVTGNHHGVLGGWTLDEQGINHASLFVGGQVGPVPGVPADRASLVNAISDSGIALVGSSAPPDDRSVDILYRKGHTKRIDSNDSGGGAYGLNDFGVLAVNGLSSYRYNPWTGKQTQLEPLPVNTSTKVFAIHDNGDVLGYSFGHSTDHIGVWKGKLFVDYFTEHYPAVPTVSEWLLWNRRGLIVETQISYPPADYGGFLITGPGKRLKLADLVSGLPNWTNILDVNEDGDLIGYGGTEFEGFDESFLLLRLHASGGPVSAKAAGARDSIRRLTAADRHLVISSSVSRSRHSEK